MTRELDAALVWFRRDLRCDDQAALYHALRAARRVYCAFVFDEDILAPLRQRGLKADRRVEFIHASLHDLDDGLAELGRQHGHDGVGLIVEHGRAVEAIPALAASLQVQAVYANHDNEPDALSRDATVRGALADRGIALHTSKDHVIFERSEVLTRTGNPFSVFTPYRKAWLAKLEEPFFLKPYPVPTYADALAPRPPSTAACPSLEAIGFARSNLSEIALPTGARGAADLMADFLPRLDHYDTAREYPSVRGPSYLGPHLRFGTVSIRRLASEALTRSRHGSAGAATWLSELAWRDFYHQILHHHPHVVGHSFKPPYDAIKWEHGSHGDALFAAWCEGRTGYPLVDAAMAQINQTGYMHNRLRMVTASFLTKDLGIDWRRGEAYFADHLNDFELASNNGDGSGRPRRAATRSPTSASSTRSRRAGASTPKASSSGATCRSSAR